jgi:NAD(P)-dependent dehydrogenase (short-subunit alcohol dehydrogenase family)
VRGSPLASPYSASKYAVFVLTRTAAIEHAPAGIRINAVCPGAIDTPMMMDETFARFPGFRESLLGFIPMGRMGRPAEVAGAIAWRSSDAASFVTGESLAHRRRSAHPLTDRALSTHRDGFRGPLGSLVAPFGLAEDGA